MSEDRVRHIERSIDVWETKNVHVEREGLTVSMQIRDSQNKVAMLVVPLVAAEELLLVLQKTCSIPGAVVSEVAIVPSRPTTIDPRYDMGAGGRL